MKNFLIAAVSLTLQFAKQGLKIISNGTSFLFTLADGTTLVPISAADATTDQQVVTLRQLKKYGGVPVTGQIDGGTPPAVVNGAFYIVTTTGGIYTAGELYRGESGVWVQVTLHDGYIIAIADDLSGGTIEFTGNHIYNYNEDTTTWVDSGPSAAETSLVRSRRASLAFGSGVTVNIGAVVPADANVLKVMVKVTTPFDGTSPTLNIGTAGDPDLLMDETEVDLTEANLYIVDKLENFVGSTQLQAAYVADGSTAGAATIEIVYSEPA